MTRMRWIVPGFTPRGFLNYDIHKGYTMATDVALNDKAQQRRDGIATQTGLLDKVLASLPSWTVIEYVRIWGDRLEVTLNEKSFMRLFEGREVRFTMGDSTGEVVAEDGVVFRAWLYQYGMKNRIERPSTVTIALPRQD